MGDRRGWTLLAALLALAGAAGAGEPADAVRALVDRLRPAESRARYDLVLPEVKLPEDRTLQVEYRVGHPLFRYVQLWFEPEAEGTRVVRTTFVTWTPDLRPPAGFVRPGLALEGTRIPRAAYDALVRKLLLVAGARLEPRAGVPAPPEVSVAPTTADGDLYLRVGDALETGARLSPRPYEELLAGALGAEARAALWFRLVADALGDFEPVREREAVAAHLCADLAGVDGWRRDLRVMALGWLGHAPALPALERLRAESGLADIACHQIELLQECAKSPEPPPVLFQLLNWDAPTVSDWAHGVMRERYPKAYKGMLYRLFDSEDPGDRRRALEELERFDAEDATLWRRALADPALQVRVVGAAKLCDGAALLAIARDRKPCEFEELQARKSAIIYLAWDDPPPADGAKIAGALTQLVRDRAEDVRIRAEAAQALGWLLRDEAVPALLEAFRAPPPKRPVYVDRGDDDLALNLYLEGDDLRMAAAEALGYLRAQAAVEPLLAFLVRPRVAHDHNLRLAIGAALARLGDARALPALRQAAEDADDREVPQWREAVAHLEAILARDLAAFWATQPPPGCPRATVRALADLFPEAALAAFAEEAQLGPRERALFERASRLRKEREGK